MAVSVFPIPSSSSGPFSYAASIPAATTKYKHTQAFAAGVYTITSSPTYNATVTFFDATSLIVETTTVSGTITINLASPATYVIISVVTGAATVSITLTSNSLVSTAISGTLDTITTTGNYNTTGALYVLCFGGGASGGTGNASNGVGANGGATGGQTAKLVYTNAATLVTCGASDGATTFGNLVTANAGGTGSAAGGSVSTPIQPQISNATTGGGGASGNFNGNTYNSGSAGAVGNIGTGGTGGNSGVGQTGTGYAAGGGGGVSGGGAGRPGIVYILRGI